LNRPGQPRPANQQLQPQQLVRPQQPANQVVQQQQPNQQVQVQQQTPQVQQQNQQQPVANRLNAAAMNKRQIPNGSKNTVNALRQAQQPLNIRK
jgi:hypothetical protein